MSLGKWVAQYLAANLNGPFSAFVLCCYDCLRQVWVIFVTKMFFQDA